MLQIIPHSHLKTPKKPPFYKLNNAKKTTPHNRKPVCHPNGTQLFMITKLKNGKGMLILLTQQEKLSAFVIRTKKSTTQRLP